MIDDCVTNILDNFSILQMSFIFPSFGFALSLSFPPQSRARKARRLRVVCCLLCDVCSCIWRDGYELSPLSYRQLLSDRYEPDERRSMWRCVSYIRANRKANGIAKIFTCSLVVIRRDYTVCVGLAPSQIQMASAHRFRINFAHAYQHTPASTSVSTCVCVTLKNLSQRIWRQWTHNLYA